MKKSSWLFVTTLMLSTMMTISANNWIGMWMGLELNMMSFIPLIMNKTKKSSSEAAMMYFLMQSMSSMLLMMMVLFNIYSQSKDWIMINSTITSCLLIKMGAAPFHKWLPEILSKMEWNKCIWLMTWQKLAPLMVMSNLNNNSMILNMSIYSSIIIGSIGGINQTSLRKMMGYSSINHMGWMLTINKSINKWLIYLIIYSLMIIMMCKMFMNYKLYFINQMGSINMTNMEKINLFCMMLSMGGLPPFIGFLPKWITIQYMINEKEFMTIMFMIMMSLIPLMFYIRIMMNLILSSNITIKWNKTHYNKFMTIMMIINFSLPFIMIMDII
uniref:NADH-ubiquinone oxidoreductase chain 2 n=1 Tax=Placosternum urus TaxID=2575660 RepID=A0A4D6X0H9_9HEMI|nr:NADH dehydrogenase subunit 2 [Placosternum urus]QCI09404.1 NADH dehydrogenase subunit 2 [Placosternum urus]